MDFIADFGQWIAELEPAFAFLLALPFAVAAAGLVALRHESRARRREHRAAALGRMSGRAAHVR